MACSRLGFFIVDLEGRASVAATLLPGAGGVQQEKLLLQTNNFCGGMASGGTVPCRDSAQFFGKVVRMNSLGRRQGKFLISAYTPRCSCVYLQFIHGVTPTMRVPAMYAGQMSNMATTLGEIRCQLIAQVICLLAVATLFA
nr:hypothetical protein [Pseudomonas fluorescens]